MVLPSASFRPIANTTNTTNINVVDNNSPIIMFGIPVVIILIITIPVILTLIYRYYAAKRPLLPQFNESAHVTRSTPQQDSV